MEGTLLTLDARAPTGGVSSLGTGPQLEQRKEGEGESGSRKDLPGREIQARSQGPGVEEEWNLMVQAFTEAIRKSGEATTSARQIPKERPVERVLFRPDPVVEGDEEEEEYDYETDQESLDMTDVVEAPKVLHWDGKSTPLRDWKEACERHLAGKGIPPHKFRQAIPAIACYLQGSALSWYQDTYGGKHWRDHPRWPDFFEELRKEFEFEPREEIARRKLAALRMGDTVPKFTTYWRSIVREIPDLPAAEAYWAYRNNLRPALMEEIEKVELLSKRRLTLVEMQTFAAKLEHLEQKYGQKPKAPKSGDQSGKDSRSGKGRWGGGGQTSQGTVRTTGTKALKAGEDREVYRAQGLCYVCGKAGHISRDCPSRPGRETGAPKPGGSKPGGGGGKSGAK